MSEPKMPWGDDFKQWVEDHIFTGGGLWSVLRALSQSESRDLQRICESAVRFGYEQGRAESSTEQVDQP
jgi:hypothetical protein